QLACSQLDPEGFSNYHGAHDQLVGQSGVNMQNITTFFSHLIVHSRESTEANRSKNRHLTAQFVKDLGKLNSVPLLLLFDSIECITEGKQVWLMHSLIPQLTPYKHIKIVLAGRSA